MCKSCCFFSSCRGYKKLYYRYLGDKCFYHNQTVECNGYEATYGLGFIQLMNSNADHTLPCRLEKHGWKFQISIDDTNSNGKGSNLERGWNIVVRHLVDNHVYYAKVIPPGQRMHIDKGNLERGNQITIYAFNDTKSPHEWLRILQVINDDLIINNIQPSFRPPPSSYILSNYISYCHDIYDKRQSTPNPDNIPNPFSIPEFVITSHIGAPSMLEWYPCDADNHPGRI